MDPDAPIVVGVDGSSTAPLLWAVQEAALTGARLRLVHAFSWPLQSAAYGLPTRLWPDESARIEARALLDHFADLARETLDRAAVTTEMVDGSAGSVLIECSRSAQAIVLGSRGVGGKAGLMLGSVGATATLHGHCPVVVVPPSFDSLAARNQRRHIVVGVDGSDCADQAAGFAVEMAQRRGVGLTAVRAWTPPGPTAPQRAPQMDLADLSSEEQKILDASVARLRATHPRVTVTTELIANYAADALLGAASQAQLLVVGSRGHGAMRSLPIGSVSLHVLHRAVCPVAVVHTRQEETDAQGSHHGGGRP